MPRKARPRIGLLPQGRAAERRLEELLAPAQAEGSPREQVATARRIWDEIQAHPDSIALRHLEDALTAVHFHPSMKSAPAVSQLVFVMRELIADTPPGLTLREMLEPLAIELARHGGRRPSNAERDRRWLEQFEARRGADRQGKSDCEIYADVAAVESKRTGKKVPASAIKLGAARARKLRDGG